MGKPRLQPYTEIGLRRIKCFRCGAPSKFQWQVCADGNQYRGVCAGCDIGLNRAALEYMRDPDVEAKMMAYECRLNANPE